MALVIELANPETDVEDVRTVVDRMVDDSVLESMYQLFEYGFGESESIEDEHLRSVLEYGDENGLVSDVGTVDEFREELEAQRQQLEAQSKRAVSGSRMKDMFKKNLKITRFLFLGDGRKEALAAQREAISEDMDLTVTVPVV